MDNLGVLVCRLACQRPARRSEPTHVRLEQREKLRVKLTPHIAAHHVQCLLVRNGFLVAPLRRQGVVHVGDAENARRKRNLFGLESVRVSGTVPALMVRFHDRPHVPWEVDVGQHLHAPHRMLLDHGPFLDGEAAGFVQDLRRDHQLADVMQQRADAEPEERFLIQPRFRGEGAGEIGNAFAMTLRVMVLRFDRLAPPPHDVEKVALEPCHLAVDVGQIGTRVKLRKEPVRAIQTLESVAVAALQPIQLRHFTGNLRREEEILAFVGPIHRDAEGLLGASEVSRFPEDDSKTLLNLPERLGVLRLLGDREGPVACGAGICVVFSCEPQRGEVYLEQHAHTDIADLLAQRYGLFIGALRCLPPLHACIEQSEIIERDADVFR